MRGSHLENTPVYFFSNYMKDVGFELRPMECEWFVYRAILVGRDYLAVSVEGGGLSFLALSLKPFLYRIQPVRQVLAHS